ncbi:MAG TPA: DUF3857 domain-containing protein [Verrucomicrobiae bacterium]|jgi:hypothetical protein|nr:DUF3857 domain-containing protein [Verrucomicrobiae bacterium]
MLKLSWLVWLFCLGSSASVLGQKEDWLPITPQDLQVKEVPGDPGADAIQMYYADYINDNDHSEFYYHRIKILTEKGRQPGGPADVEIIPPFSMPRISDLKARTIHPDGSIVEFTGKPFEKTVLKGHGFKFQAKTFTFPDVTPGSIIEYKYKLRGEEGYLSTINSWTIQHGLFTVREHLVFKASEVPLEGVSGGTNVSFLSRNLDKKPTIKNHTVELTMENVPAFQPESNMPPEDDYKPQVRFFYGGSETTSAEKFWQERGKRLNDAVNRFIGNHGEVRDAAVAAIGTETDPEKKLRKLYARSQEIRNTTYERERSEEERKKEQIKPNENVGDVLKRGYGDRDDITLLLTAMARAAGMDASVFYVSSRQERFFNKNLMDRGQLDSMVAVVQLNGKDVYLDPGTKFCPYGEIRWFRTATAALKPGKDGGTFVQLPSASHQQAVTSRTADMMLAEDGSVQGTVTVQYKGSEALEHRLDAINTDATGRTKDLENEMKGWVPNGAFVKLIDAQGWEATNDPLVAHFTVSVPSYASLAGKRLLLPSCFFQSRQKDAFKHPERKYPVYFPYAFSELDKVSVKLPAGYSLEGVPPVQDASLPYARYQSVTRVENSQLITQRTLLFNGIFLPVQEYSQIKDFFGKVQAGDEQQAVLRSGGNVNAQKGN